MNYYTSLFKGIIEKRKLIWDLSKADFKKRIRSRIRLWQLSLFMYLQPLYWGA